MSFKFKHLFLFLFVASSLIYFSCNKTSLSKKDELVLTQNQIKDLTGNITNWLKKRKEDFLSKNANTPIAVSTNGTSSQNGSPNKAANVAMLIESLDFNNLEVEQMDKHNSLITVPISDKVKSLKNLNTNSKLSLMVLMNEYGSVKWARIVYFIPSEDKKHEKISASEMHKILLNQPLPNNGVYKMLSISGTWISQFEYRNGKFHSFGYITTKENKSKQTNLICIDWYLITTYHFSNGSSYQTSEYVGQTCSGCDTGSFQSLCEPGDGGGTSCTMTADDALLAATSTTADAYSGDIGYTTGAEYIDAQTGKIKKNANMNPWDFAVVKIKEYYMWWPLGYTAYYGGVLYKNDPNDTWKWESVTYQGQSRTSGTIPPCYSVEMTVTPRSTFLTNNATNAASTLSFSATCSIACLTGITWGQPIVGNDLSANWGAAR